MKPARNEACWKGTDLTESECCGPEALEECFSSTGWTHRRCCDLKKAEGAGCSTSEFSALEDLQLFFSTGVLPSEHKFTRMPFDEFASWLMGGDFDTELEQCAPLALSALCVRAELAAAAPGASMIVPYAWATFQVAENAARARGDLGESPFLFPRNVVYAAWLRMDVAWQILGHGLRSTAQTILNITGYGSDSIGKGCMATQVPSLHACVASSGEGTRRSVEAFAMVAISEHQSLAMLRQASRAGWASEVAEVIVLAKLLVAGNLRGVRDADAKRLLASACEDLVVNVPMERRNHRRLTVAAQALHKAMRENLVGSYAESDKDQPILELVRASGAPQEGGFFAEIGVGPSAMQCNSRVLRQHWGWRGVMLDQCDKLEEIGLYRRLVEPHTIAALFDELHVPRDLDLLSIDVDGMDFWLFRALLQAGFRPRAVIIEFCTGLGLRDIVIRYSPGSAVTFARHDARNIPLTCASLSALVALGAAFGYRLIRQQRDDLFFVRGDLAASHATLRPEDPEDMSLTVRTDEARELVIDKLLASYGHFFTTAAQAISEGGDALAMDRRWTLRCLAEALGELCDDAQIGVTCYKQWT